MGNYKCFKYSNLSSAERAKTGSRSRYLCMIFVSGVGAVVTSADSEFLEILKKYNVY